MPALRPRETKTATRRAADTADGVLDENAPPSGSSSIPKKKTGRPPTKWLDIKDDRQDIPYDPPLVTCKWLVANGPGPEDRAPCGIQYCPATESVAQHMQNHHHGDLKMRTMEQASCKWQGCQTKKAMNKQNLARHISKSHLGINQVVCVWCGYAERKDAYFKRHRSKGQCRKREGKLNALYQAARNGGDPTALLDAMAELVGRGGSANDIVEILVERFDTLDQCAMANLREHFKLAPSPAQAPLPPPPPPPSSSGSPSPTPTMSPSTPPSPGGLQPLPLPPSPGGSQPLPLPPSPGGSQLLPLPLLAPVPTPAPEADSVPAAPGFPLHTPPQTPPLPLLFDPQPAFTDPSPFLPLSPSFFLSPPRHVDVNDYIDWAAAGYGDDTNGTA